MRKFASRKPLWLDKCVPNVTIKRIPDGTHWVIHEKPALVDSYIREFIKSK